MNIHDFGLLPNKNKRSQMKQEKINIDDLYDYIKEKIEF